MNINDDNYLSIVENILSNEEFNKIKTIEHHGTSRYEHSLRVSYFSYIITKLLHLDYEDVARAGLLHDFFLSSEDRTFKDRFVSYFTHPKYAVDCATSHFDLSDREINIIESHMFPVYRSIPKYAESWIVSLVDKVVCTYEFSVKFRYKFSYAMNLFVLLILNNLR